MKFQMTLSALLGALFFGGSALASVVTFNNTAGNSPGYNFYGINGTYAEAGVTLSATSGTYLYTVNPVFFNTDHRYFSVDGTDYGDLQHNFGQIPQSATLAAAAPFSLQSLQAANLNGNGGTLHLTGTLAGGGTVGQDFALVPGNYLSTPGLWSTLVLGPGWTNLASVELNYPGPTAAILALDNIVINEPGSPVPVPAAGWLFASALAGGLRLKKRR